MKILCCVSFIFLVVGIQCGNILVYNSYFTHSHFNFIARLADILQNDGKHNVTVLIPELNPETGPSSKSAKVIVKKWKSPKKKVFVDHQHYIWGNKHYAFWMNEIATILTKNFRKQCEDLLTDQEFISGLKKENYDFGFFEPFDYCGIGLFKLLGIKNYAVATPMAISGKMAVIHGLPGRSVSGLPLDIDDHPELTFFERLQNFIDPYFTTFIFNAQPLNEDIVQKYIDPEFDANEAQANAKLFFVNMEEHLDFPRLINHKIIYIGGIMVNQTFVLPKEYKDIFDSASKGVVLVSFGSLATSKDMPIKYKESILKMFAAYPEINFIWKYEDLNDKIGKNLSNVYKFKWVDQSAILNEKKTIGFVTHGGMNSVSEAGHLGIPLIVVPLFVDQFRNAKMLEFRKTAIIVEKSQISAESMISAIEKLTNQYYGYRTRAKKMAEMIKKKPMDAKKRFIKYFNFAFEHKDEPDFYEIGQRKHNFIKFYNLDIYLLLIFCGLTVVSISWVLLKIILQRLLSFNSKIKNE